MDANSAYSIRLGSNVSISDKGTYVSIRWISGDDYKSSIFKVGKDGMERITNGGNESMVQAVDKGIYYLNKTEKGDVLQFRKQHGEVSEILQFPRIYKYIVTNEGIFILGEERADNSKPFVAKKLRYRDGWGRGFLWTRPSLYFMEKNKNLTTVVKGDFDVIDFDVLNEKLIYSTTEDFDELALGNVYESSLDGSKRRRITEGSGEAKAVAIGPNGEVSYLGHRNGRNAWAVDRIIIPEKGVTSTCGFNSANAISTDIFDSAHPRLIWERSENAIYFVGTEFSYCSLYRMSESENFAPRMISPSKISVRNFDVWNGHVAYIYTDSQHPSILNVDGVDYDLNPEVLGVKPRELNYAQSDGWILFKDRKAPTILSLHGGRPYYAYGDSYSIEFQFLYSQGFNVIYCNPKVTSNYGEKFAKSSLGDAGDNEMSIILDFFRRVSKEYRLEGKFGITGGSYGGYLTNRIIGQTNEFSAAISERSITNQLSMVGTSDDGFWFTLDDLAISGYPYSQDNIIKLLKKGSPIWNAEKIETPTLLIHGENDYRAPIEQSEQLYVALSLKGVPTEFIRYQNETHEHARSGIPSNMKHRLNSKLEWFKRYLS